MLAALARRGFSAFALDRSKNIVPMGVDLRWKNENGRPIEEILDPTISGPSRLSSLTRISRTI